MGFAELEEQVLFLGVTLGRNEKGGGKLCKFAKKLNLGE
jgi:hypothetical protein